MAFGGASNLIGTPAFMPGNLKSKLSNSFYTEETVQVVDHPFGLRQPPERVLDRQIGEFLWLQES